MSEISWFTPPLSQFQGYGLAAVETIRALQRNGLKVSWNLETAYVHVNFIQPEYYGGHEKQYRIGYTPWESTGLPEMWPEYMAQMQEIWTTSNFCKEIFENAGVEDVTVIPHGIDPEIFRITERTLTDKFVFFHMGGGINGAERKGAKITVKAFLECFGDNEDVVLLMKGNGKSEARWVNERGNLVNISYHPRVQVIENVLDVEDIYRLYALSHCCVYPTNGEGFGLIPFQAIATGLPTITTNLTGTADFAELSMPLKATWGDGYGVHEGLWAEPDYEDLCNQMIYVVNNWEQEKIKAVNSAKIIHSTQTWDHVAKKIINHLGDKVDISLGG
jgi:glycosyltransferase involved in cell wall biosynthesis